MYGFTIKSGQVLSSDGKVYDFASPEEKKKIIKRYKEGGEQVGTKNNQLFIVYEDEIINIPLNEISNLSDENLDLRIERAFSEIDEKILKAKNKAKEKVKDNAKEKAKDKAKEKAKDKAKEKAKDKAKEKAQEKLKEIKLGKKKKVKKKN